MFKDVYCKRNIKKIKPFIVSLEGELQLLNFTRVCVNEWMCLFSHQKWPFHHWNAYRGFTIGNDETKVQTINPRAKRNLKGEVFARGLIRRREPPIWTSDRLNTGSYVQSQHDHRDKHTCGLCVACFVSAWVEQSNKDVFVKACSHIWF